MKRSKYLEWLLDFVCDEREKRDYSSLFFKLFHIEFTWIIELDSNRAQDGIDLRKHFSNQTGNPEPKINEPCSVLEMLVALSLRIEEGVMFDFNLGDRTGKWFWGMICNLDLLSMTNAYYNEDYVEFIIFRFLNREYDFDGRGGLFRIERFEGNMKTIEIWYQALFYFNSIEEEEG